MKCTVGFYDDGGVSCIIWFVEEWIYPQDREDDERNYSDNT